MIKTYRGLLSKATLQVAFEEAKQHCNYIGLLIETKGSPAPELIVNGSANFDTKLAYLQEAYDDRLHLKSAPDKIRIKAIVVADLMSNFAQIMRTARYI